MLEGDFQSRVTDLATLRGWIWVHYRPARTAKGWHTPLQGKKGCPDLILARRGVVLLVELKSDTGSASRDQKDWLAALGPNARLWRPRDWPEILETLA